MEKTSTQQILGDQIENQGATLDTPNVFEGLAQKAGLDDNPAELNEDLANVNRLIFDASMRRNHEEYYYGQHEEAYLDIVTLRKFQIFLEGLIESKS